MKYNTINKKFKTSLIVALFLSSFIVSAAYNSFTPPNLAESETIENIEITINDRKYTLSYGGRRYFFPNKTEYWKNAAGEITLNETESSVKLGLTPPIYDPPQTRSTGDQDYLIHPTSFTDASGLWSNEIDAYDWDNGTNADMTTSGDTYDLDLITWNTTDNQAEDITSVDIYIRADWSISANDYLTVRWRVGSAEGTGTFVMDNANQGNDQIISFENVAEPNDASWSWADIANLDVDFDFEKLTGGDVVVIGIDEVWGWIDVAAGAPPDTTDPEISSPIDQEVELGSTSNSITWTVGDENPNNYVIYRNDSNVESGSWTNGTLDADSGECDGLSLGVYNFSLWIDDVSGNDVVDLVWFTVSDSTNPLIDSPSDSSYEYGSSSNLISWTGTDLDSDIWDTTLDLSPHDSGSWVSGTPINVNIDGLGLGTGYSFVITIYDGTGNHVSDTVLIDVEDSTSPIPNNPSDFSYELGSTSNEVSWTVTDLLPDNYRIYQNETKIDEGTWVSGTPITKNIDALSLGIYNFTLFINDTSNNKATDIIWVTVEDTTNPLIDSPSDFSYELGSSSNTVDWTATDLSANDYYAYKNSSQIDYNSWVTSVPISVNVDGFNLGLWNITIICYDNSGNYVIDLLWLTVEDTTNPLIDSPIDDTVELGSVVDSIDWTGTDLDADLFEVFKNSSTWDSGAWTTSIPIVIELDSLTLGYWNFTIQIWDGSGNYIIDLVWILCEDTTSPEITNPSDFSYELGSSSNTIDWTGTDLDANDYYAYKNSSQIDYNSWVTSVPISVDVDGFNLGLWNITIILYDGSGNYIVDLLWLTVEDTTNPQINNPLDDEYQFGSTGNKIDWLGTDLDANDYEVFKNETTFDTGFWVTSVTISIDIDNFSLGIYNLTIIIWDGSGNYIVDLVWITVSDIIDETDPIISSPNDNTIELGSVVDEISWTVNEDNPNNFIVYQNDSNVDSGTYLNGIPIIFELDGFTLGLWNVTLWVDDDSGNWAVDLVWILCEDTTNPQINSPSDFTYELGSTSNLIIWLGTDLDSDNYEVELDLAFYDSGSWTTSVNIEINIDGLAIGLDYSFVITIYDGSGNHVSDTVLIDVEDTTNPLIDNPIDDTIELGSIVDSIDWTGTDLAADLFEVFKNSSTWDSGAWTTSIPIVIELDSLTLGYWNFTIIIYDSSNNYVVDLVWILCEDTTSPLISNPSDDTIELGSIIDSITWLATDLDANNYIIYKNDSNVDSNGWISGINIIFSLDGFNLGLWNMTIICYDSSNNYVVDLVWILCEDTTSPEINSPLDDSYQIGTTGNEIIWLGQDLDSNIFEVFKNSSNHDSGSWSSGINIMVNIDGFAEGIWNLTIIIWDGSENYIVDLVWITVTPTDSTSPILNSPANITYTEGSSGNKISWLASDDYANNYTVFYCEVSYQNGTWISGIAIVIGIDGLVAIAAGSMPYNFTLIVWDENMNYSVDAVWVTVNAQTSVPADPHYPPKETTPIADPIPIELLIILLALAGLAVILFVLNHVYRKKK